MKKENKKILIFTVIFLGIIISRSMFTQNKFGICIKMVGDTFINWNYIFPYHFAGI